MSAPGCCSMDVGLAATLEDVERFFLEFRARCVCLPASDDRFAAELLLREALTNAVVHGCRARPAGRIRCVLLMIVEDGGGGFDWRAAWNRPPDGEADSGRGLEIFRRYASRVRFSPRGNAVAIVKRFR
jgi:anti-sigma regulatory factor (Ser/Thr protein kinase)